MFHRLSRVVFTILGLVKANNAALSFNAPSTFLTAAATMSVDQCGTTHNIKPVSVSSTDGQAPIFRISEPAEADAIFGVSNNEYLRCVDKNALKAAGLTDFNLKIEVSSATEPAISFPFKLTITGLVTNPNAPTFTPVSHSLTISRQKFDEDGEFTLPKTFVVTDADNGAAGTVTIFLKDSPAEFGILSQSDTVSIQVRGSTLALASPYELIVIATDKGTPPKTGSATMTITLECATPSFGQNCSSICNCINDSHCDPVDGICDIGLCKPGWQGPSCDQECTIPSFGQNCSSICNCINDSHCDPVDGICDIGRCKPGWQGPSCDQECTTPSFGQNCFSICNCINDSHCDPVDGICDTGLCKPGWQGPSCDQECSSPYFGQNCSFICNCINDSFCDPVYGICGAGLCKARWQGPSCDQAKLDSNPPDDQYDTVHAALLIVLAVFVVVCVVVIVCLLRKKSRCMRTSYHMETPASSTHKMVEVSPIDQY